VYGSTRKGREKRTTKTQTNLVSIRMRDMVTCLCLWRYNDFKEEN